MGQKLTEYGSVEITEKDRSVKDPVVNKILTFTNTLSLAHGGSAQ